MKKTTYIYAFTLLFLSRCILAVEIDKASNQLGKALDLVAKVNRCRQITPQNEEECKKIDQYLVREACMQIALYGTDDDLKAMLMILDYSNRAGFDREYTGDYLPPSPYYTGFFASDALADRKQLTFELILEWIKSGEYPNILAVVSLSSKKWGWNILNQWESEIESEIDPQVAERLIRSKNAYLEFLADSLYNSDPDECEFALKKYLEDPHGARSRYRINEDKILSILSGLKNKWKETQIDLLADFFSLTRFKDDEKNPTKRSGYPQDPILYLNYPAVEAMVKIPGLEMNDVIGWIEEGKKPELMAGLLYARWGKDALTGLDAAIKSETDSTKRKSLEECKRLILENPNRSIYEPTTELPGTPNQ